ncbi:Dyp-type peroxidase family [Methylocella silvestris BL2]|uniref:Deferrochelatase n=1 Tax=Methylocella silvestris (strain DSM 15510 / CIP 108128 / LMG 27833 / NCIMB 13906 / BL2) TaxID=395965 RepID=B8ELX3_METSB|nr:iron uptake transporter deferrochelatase/peroxidase subunit [Methylocella silvestris]ACK50754.1 Dyp-type peroxidase family [Methylocella silvestris BL2]
MSNRKTPLSLSPDRRSLLLAGGALAGALSAGAPQRALAQSDSTNVTNAPISEKQQQRNPFYGAHQAGIVTPRQEFGMIATFDVIASSPPDLVRLFRTLTARFALLTQGWTPPELDPRLPPPDSGLLGPVVEPDNLTATLSVGSSMFDERFGLAKVKPAVLTRMTSFKNDALDPALCHGDLSIQFSSNSADANIHALRDILKSLPDLLVLRWKQEGYVPALPAKPGQPPESARNFLGFRDGSANPHAGDPAAMNEIVWVQPGSKEPAWAAGGTYQAVRIIRNFVERWDRTPLGEQERIIGRRKPSGAPFDGKTEADVPDFAADPNGKITPIDAHIRLANPRTPESRANLILRRPFNYSNGVSKSGQLEMGLLFIAYQADLEKGFITVQHRLDGEPLEEYINPIGGGFFYTLPGARDEQDFLGRSMLEAAGIALS